MVAVLKRVRAASSLRDAGGNDPKIEQLPGILREDSTQEIDDLQLARSVDAKAIYDLSAHRRAWIMRRYPVNQLAASSISELIFYAEVKVND